MTNLLGSVVEDPFDVGLFHFRLLHIAEQANFPLPRRHNNTSGSIVDLPLWIGSDLGYKYCLSSWNHASFTRAD